MAATAHDGNTTRLQLYVCPNSSTPTKLVGDRPGNKIYILNIYTEGTIVYIPVFITGDITSPIVISMAMQSYS